MPSLKKKVAGFIRHLSVTGQGSSEAGGDLPPKSPASGCFIQRYLSGQEPRSQPDILYGKNCQELPVKRLDRLERRIFAAYSGPDGGLVSVNRRGRHVGTSDPDVKYIDDQDSTSALSTPIRRRSKASLDEACAGDWEGIHLFSSNYGSCFQLRRTLRKDGRVAVVDNSNMNIRVMGRVYSVGPSSPVKGHDANSNHISNHINNEPAISHTQPSDSPRSHLLDNNNTINFENNIDSNGTSSSDGVVAETPALNTKRRSESKEASGASEDILVATATEEIAGVVNWNRPHLRAFGSSTTLYECHPITHQNAGNPIADTFAIVARENSAILALADGVNWGEKASLAARCAVHGCVDYLNKALYTGSGVISNTTDIFIALLRSFHAAHNLILQEDGMLTTLTAAVVVPLNDSNEHYVVCVCNVGDSLAYVYSKKHGVREITQGSHDIYSMRDMRDALGALGPVDGQNPELNNLTCSLTVVDPGDIVFLTSDGISDNFDPVVGKFAVPKKPENVADATKSSTQAGKHMRRAQSVQPTEDDVKPDIFLPIVEAYQRHELTLLRMEDLLSTGVSGEAEPCTDAKQLCTQMVDFATKLTVAKRRILEDPELYSSNDVELSRAEQRNRRRKVCEKLAMVPGKLDHASVVGYMVGRYREPNLETVQEDVESNDIIAGCAAEIEKASTSLRLLESIV